MKKNGKLTRTRATNFLPDGLPIGVTELQHTFVFFENRAPKDGLEAIRTERFNAISEISIGYQEDGPDCTTDSESDDTMYKQVSSMAINEPDLVYTHLLQLSQCYEPMAKNNKIVVFTDEMTVRKAFYGLIYNSTRTGLVVNSETMVINGVLSVTDFIMIIMMLWKFRENFDEMKGTPLSHKEFELMDIASIKISRWKELLKQHGKSKELITISATESLFRAVQILKMHRIHRLPVLDSNTGDCTYILTHRRILHYMWKHCTSMPRPKYMHERVADLGVGTFSGIHYATEDMTLLKALDLILDNEVSGLPIVVDGETKRVVEVYSRFDAISILFNKSIDLNITVKEAILQRAAVCGGRDGVVTAPFNVTMWNLICIFIEKNVHRVFLVDEQCTLKGLVSLSDIVDFMVLRPARIAQEYRTRRNTVEEENEEEDSKTEQ